MPSVPIRAAGEALPTVSRRAFLRTSASAAIATTAAGGALAMQMQSIAVEPADPILDLIAEYRKQQAIFVAASDSMPDDDEFTAFYEQTTGPLFRRLRDACPPARTLAGAVAALQLVADENANLDHWNASGSVTKAGLAYFNGRTLPC
ncbi:hypothetical protein [Aureimonas leprariae]|uniref:Uncharacterized protein n=1 Tax=Plantimonas leprariae TaxID=2615207 RepID=A0A7V7PPX3_9HYPH|nr:hypothetical protein [Aureimonas leprariae]KAB0680089.1 hypothetical protein F6X38_09780 [Aureimonas leprariae]